RLSDQWNFGATSKIEEKECERGRPCADAQRHQLVASNDIHRFTLLAGRHWHEVRKVTPSVEDALTKAIRGIAVPNKELMGVLPSTGTNRRQTNKCADKCSIHWPYARMTFRRKSGSRSRVAFRVSTTRVEFATIQGHSNTECSVSTITQSIAWSISAVKFWLSKLRLGRFRIGGNRGMYGSWYNT